MSPFATMLAALAIGTASALIAIMAVRWFENKQSIGFRYENAASPCALLFEGERLIDATASAKQLLAAQGSGSDMQRFQCWLSANFEAAPQFFEKLETRAEHVIYGAKGYGSTRLSCRGRNVAGGRIRIEISDPNLADSLIVVNTLTQAALETEVHLLRHLIDDAPVMIWKQDSEGRIVWANGAYMRQAEISCPDAEGWPLPRLLDPVSTNGAHSSRAKLRTPQEDVWYDCHARQRDGEQIVYALPANATVRAEASLREFLQTLTKTFADLPIGLAIFDRERRLQLFNPALIDLMGLSAGFLTARPTLHTLLDRLRENRMVPEPKDYRGWRQQIASLETAASTGTHTETWSLPEGRTIRVTGRPHPDGALAFLFDDITPQIVQTRRFRADLALASQLLDTIEDPLIVFDGKDRVVTCNAAFETLTGQRPVNVAETSQALKEVQRQGDRQFDDALRIFHGQTHTGVFHPMTGPALHWKMTPLTDSKRMLRFHPATRFNARIPDRATA